MVYLREILKHNKAKLIQYKNIELAAYLCVQNFEELPNHSFELSPDEEIALIGYKKESVEVSKVVSIISKAPVKGLSAISNVYKLAGLYLSAKKELIQMYSQEDLQTTDRSLNQVQRDVQKVGKKSEYCPAEALGPSGN